MMSNRAFQTLDYNSPAVPKITWDRLRSISFVIAGIAVTAAIVCAAIVLWAARLPLPNFCLVLVGSLIGLASGGLWLASAAIEIAIVKGVGRPARRRANVLLTLTPVILASVWALVASGLPCRLMFLANKPAMDRWAQRVLATPAAMPSAAQIGYYDAVAIDPIPGGVEFLVVGSGFIDQGGFAYSPSGSPPPTGADTYRPIGRGWYVRTFRF